MAKKTKTTPTADQQSRKYNIQNATSALTSTKASTNKRGNTVTPSRYQYSVLVKKGVAVREYATTTSRKISTTTAEKRYTTRETKVVGDLNKGGHAWYYISELGGYVIDSDIDSNGTHYQKSTVKTEITTDKDNNIFVYQRASTSSDIVKTLVNGANITSSRTVKDEKGNTWYYIPAYQGYVRAKDVDSAKEKTSWSEYLTKTQKEEVASIKQEQAAKQQAAIEQINSMTNIPDYAMKDLEGWVQGSTSEEEQAAKMNKIGELAEEQAVNAWMDNYAIKTDSLYEASKTMFNNNMIGIFGAPYQFSEDADEKVEGTIYGVTYADKILTKMPLLIATPGKVSFMSEFKKSSRIQEIKKILGFENTDANDANGQVTLAALAGTNTGQLLESGKYFTFETDTTSYFEYVNGMCWSGARFLGMQNTVIRMSPTSKGYKLGEFNWANAVKNTVRGYVSDKPAVSFYVDSYTTSDEDFSNSTTESQLASKINSYADIGREIQFILGNTTGKVPSWMTQENLGSTLEEIQSMADNYKFNGQLLIDVAQNFATVATGGQLLFPEIWADSDYSKSFSLNIKLRTPDADLLSWYLNIYVPLCHLVAFAAPRQVSGEVANGYMSPFLIRAYLKGAFNCDCGIVTSLSISRGKEGSWTLNGLPTEVDVSMTIKDLYSLIMITKASDVNWFMNNTALMDYIANNCGININEPDIERHLSMFAQLQTNQVLQFPNRFFSQLQLDLEKAVGNVYNKFLL